MSDHFNLSRYSIVWLAALALHIIVLLLFTASKPDDALIRGGAVSVGFSTPAFDMASGGNEGQGASEETENETANAPQPEAPSEDEELPIAEEEPDFVQKQQSEPEPVVDSEPVEPIQPASPLVRDEVKPAAPIQDTISESIPEPVQPETAAAPPQQNPSAPQTQETSQPTNASASTPRADESNSEESGQPETNIQTTAGIGEPNNHSEMTSSASGGATDTENTSTVAGNSADENYKGIVMKHLAPRVRRLRASGAGASVVGFTIMMDGEVEDVRVVSSSNSNRFDREALRAVARSAPFPIPPGDVNTNFTVRITGR